MVWKGPPSPLEFVIHQTVPIRWRWHFWGLDQLGWDGHCARWIQCRSVGLAKRVGSLWIAVWSSYICLQSASSLASLGFLCSRCYHLKCNERCSICWPSFLGPETPGLGNHWKMLRCYWMAFALSKAWSRMSTRRSSGIPKTSKRPLLSFLRNAAHITA